MKGEECQRKGEMSKRPHKDGTEIIAFPLEKKGILLYNGEKEK